MAMPDIITIAAGVTRQDFDWGYLLIGRRDALLGTNLIESPWFPDGIERNKYGKVVRTRHCKVDGRNITVRQEQKKFAVHVNYTEEEKRANESREIAPAQRPDPVKMANANMDTFVAAARAAFNLENESHRPWGFSLEVQVEAARLCSAMVGLFRSSPIASRKESGALTRRNAHGQRFKLHAVK